MSRGEDQGQQAGAAAMVAHSLSIRGTGHSAGSFASRSPIHGSNPSYLSGSGGSSSSSRSAHRRSISVGGINDTAGGGGGGGGCPTGFRNRQRGSNGNGNGKSDSSRSGNNTNSESAERSGIITNSRDRAAPAVGGSPGGDITGGVSSAAGTSIGGASLDACRDGTVDGCGERLRKGGFNLRPSTASQRRHQQLVPSPRFSGSRPGSTSGARSESGGGDAGSDGVGGGGSRGRDESGRVAASAAERMTAASESSGDIVKIHVCDESRGITRDFPCERRLLLREMKYFQSYLVGASSPYDEIDILVHCDVRIFEWLFQYIHSRTSPSSGSTGSERATVGGNNDASTDRSCRSADSEGEGEGACSRASGPPPLEVPLAVSILISSDFLQMQRLVAECLKFVGEHLTEIVKLPIDLSCLSDKMVLQLAKIMTLEQLAVARDRKDKLLSRVHKKRIELDFRDRSPHSDNAISCCRHCAGLFSEKVRDVMTCRAAPPTVSFRGRLVRRHEALLPWSLTRTVTSLHRRGMSWTAVYWFLWGLTRPLYCTYCREVFLAGDIGECHFHPQEACFSPKNTGSSTFYSEDTCLGGNIRGEGSVQQQGGEVEGFFPCCRKPACRFSVEPGAVGCMTTDHIVRGAGEGDDADQVLRVLRLQRPNICYHDWRVAVREETRAAIRASSGSIGSDGGGSTSMRGAGVGVGLARTGGGSKGGLEGAQNTSSEKNNQPGGNGAGGRGDDLSRSTVKSSVGASGAGDIRDKVLVKRQPSAGSKRLPRGSDLPPAVVTTTTTTTTSTIAAATSSGGRDGSNRNRSSANGGISGGGASSSANSQTSFSSPSRGPAAKRPSSAGSTRRTDASGGSAAGEAAAAAASAAAAAAAEEEVAGSAAPRPGQIHRSAAEGKGAGGVDGEVGAVAMVAAVPTSSTAPVPAVIPTAAVEIGQDCRRIWAPRASEALSSREKGLLPNEHPVQTVALQLKQCCPEKDCFSFSSKECPRVGEERKGQTRRWQADALRESDGLRMAQMCEDLRRKRRS
ncbi:unnamed protein product [Scytosiphon promiscuus]